MTDTVYPENETEQVANAKWRPIETAPKDKQRVLLLVEPYGASTGHWDGNKWDCHSCLNKKAQPSHWMPLPPPPERDLLRDAIEIAKTGSTGGGYRNYPGTGGIWFGRNADIPGANFVDWGLARATAEILNAVVEGRLIRR